MGGNREMCKAGLNIPELHMPADYVTPQQLNPDAAWTASHWLKAE